MKAIYNILILFILINISITSYSQNNFNFIYGSNEWSEIPSEAVEDEQGNIFIVGYKFVENDFPNSSFIIKISPEGLLMNEKSFSVADSSLKLSGIILLDDSIYLFGTKGPIDIGIENCICGYILDTDLNVQSFRCHKTYAGDVQIYFQPIVFLNENFTICMNFYQAWDALADIGFYKLNRNLDSVMCKLDFRDGIQLAYDFMYSPSQNLYKVFGTGTYPGTYPSYSELIKFDSSFNFLSVDTIPWQLVNQFSVKQFDDSTYLLTGKKSNYNPTKMNIGLIKANEFDQLQWHNQYGKEGDTVNYPGVSDGIDFIYKDAIFLGGTSNIIPLHYPWQPEDSWLMLNQLDSNLDIKWQRFYGGDAFYHLRGLKATQDGGCLMYATRYDENTQDQEFDIYILKVDSLGIMTSISDNFTIPVQQLSIVPNPANQYVSIRYPDIFGSEEKEIIIYNSIGIPVKSFNAKEEVSGIRADISELPAGLYFVVLMVNGRKTGTGKMIVRHP